MTFNDDTIARIKDRLSITDVMQNYAFVENRGGRKWVKCPFHGNGMEKTASCSLNEERGTYHCFGCGESGDIFKLVMKKEGLDFRSALEVLAAKAGVELQDNNRNTDEAKKERKDRENMYDLYKRLAGTFNYLLKNNPEAQGAREYLKKRNVSDEMVETFQLGYAPADHEFLYRFLLKNNYSREFLNQSGLFSQKREGWPLFSCRLMFPIFDRQGRVIAFSGRDLSGNERAPKYINSPETRIYQKKENFFGLYQAKNTIASGKMQPILCEGNFDVVAMHQAGFTSAVASLGTSFTDEQCANMKKWFPSVTGFNILFDSDEAGQNSTERAIGIINSKGLEQKVHKFTSAKDASELLENGGEEAVRAEFEAYVSGFDYLVQRNLTRYDIKNARGKSGLVNSLSEYLLKCSSEVERDSYILTLATRLGLSEESIKEDLKRVNQPKQPYAAAEEMEPEAIQRRQNKVSHDLFVMLYMVNHPGVFKMYRRKLSFGDLDDRDAQMVYMALENAMREGTESKELVASYISDPGLKDLVQMSFALDEYSKDNPVALDEAIDRIRLRGMEKRREILTNQLKLGSALEGDELSDIFERKLNLDKEIAELKTRLQTT